MITVLGIHTNLTGASSAGDAPMTGGHAWITVHRNMKVEYYGLWPDSHPLTEDNGSGTDIRAGLEKHDRAADSRYYELTNSQIDTLDRLLKQNVKWGYTHNCSSWATEIIREVTKEKISANEPVIAFVETPRQLGMSIRRLEAKSPTSLKNPTKTSPSEKRNSSSFIRHRATLVK